MRTLPVVSSARYYVSLGDSMSIDASAGGPGCGAASRLAGSLPADFRLIPLARDGATSAQVRYVQIPQLKEMRIAPALVTLTMGGNDLLQTFGDPDFVRPALDALKANAGAVLADLRALCLPDAPILVGTVPGPPELASWRERFDGALEEAARSHGASMIGCGTIEPNAHGAAALAGLWKEAWESR